MRAAWIRIGASAGCWRSDTLEGSGPARVRVCVSIAAGGKIWEEGDIGKILLQNHGLLMLLLVGRVAT